MTGLIIGISVGIPLALIAGAILGGFIAMKIFKKQLKKNPPISEKQIRSMYAQMGRKPSESQVKQVMKSIKKDS
jgi:uncharacterized protein YneF (UPF0154 family)